MLVGDVDGESLEVCGRLVDGTLAQLLLEDRQEGVGDSVGDVDGIGEQVVVDRVVARVQLEGDALVRHGAPADVGRVGLQDHPAVVVPGDEPVGAVAHGLVAVGLDVLEGGFRHRVVGVVAQADLEVRRRGVQLDREGEVIDLGQPGQLGVLVVGEALDPLEEGGAELGIGQQSAELPGLDEGVGGHRAAVGEGPARFESDREVLVVRGLNGGGHLVDDVTVLVVADQTGIDQVEDPPTTELVGVGGQQRVLGLGVVGQDDAAVGAGAGLLVDRDGPPVEVDVGGVAGVAAEAVLVPQRDAGQVGEELGLGLAEIAVGGLGVGGGAA